MQNIYAHAIIKRQSGSVETQDASAPGFRPENICPPLVSIFCKKKYLSSLAKIHKLADKVIKAKSLAQM